MTGRLSLSRWFRRRRSCPDCGTKTSETFCETCGYDLVTQTRSSNTPPPRM